MLIEQHVSYLDSTTTAISEKQSSNGNIWSLLVLKLLPMDVLSACYVRERKEMFLEDDFQGKKRDVPRG